MLERQLRVAVITNCAADRRVSTRRYEGLAWHPLGSMSSPTRTPAWTPLVPGVAIVLVWVAWAWLDGGYGVTHWVPLGLTTLGLVAFGFVLQGRSTRQRTLTAASVIAFGVLVVWSAFSILWAEIPGSAWIASNVTLIYGVTFAAFALWPCSPRHRARLLATYVAGIGVLGIVTLAGASSGDAGSSLIEGRLAEPTAYANGSVALWMLAFWPAVYLGSSKMLQDWLRPVWIGCGALFVQLAVLGQSRGWLLVLPVAAGVFLLLARQRLRSLLGLILCVGAALVTLPWLLDVFTTYEDGADLGGAVDHAALATVVSCIGAGAGAGVWVWLERRIDFDKGTHRRLGIIAISLSVLVLVAGTGAAIVRGTQVEHWLSERAHEFTEGNSTDKLSSRFTGRLGDPSRYQIWRIGWREFTDSPLLGSGADSFAVAYLAEREDNFHDVLYPHSIELRFLSGLGVPGLAFFLVALGAAILRGLVRRRELDPIAGGACGAALTSTLYWLLHGSVDVFWEIPALAGPALGMLALAGAAAERDVVSARTEQSSAQSTPRRLALSRVALLVVLLVAGTAVALPWLSTLYQDSAAKISRDNPEAAYRRLALAASLDPLDARPALLEASVAARQGDLERANRALTRAIGREPNSWYAYLQRALLAGAARDFERADEAMARTLRLNPLDRGVQIADALIRNRARIDPDAVNRVYLDPTATVPGVYLRLGFEEDVPVDVLFDQIEIGPGGSLEQVEGPAASGRRSLRIVLGDAPTYGLATARRELNGVVVSRFGLQLGQLPTSPVLVAGLVGESPAGAGFRVLPDGTLEASARDESGSGGVWATGPVLVPGRWYRVEARFNTTGPATTLDWMVDGVSQPMSSFEATPSVAWPRIILGSSLGNSSPGTVLYFDDVLVSTRSDDYGAVLAAP